MLAPGLRDDECRVRAVRGGAKEREREIESIFSMLVQSDHSLTELVKQPSLTHSYRRTMECYARVKIP